MSFFKWLFGRRSSINHPHHNAASLWSISETGNPTFTQGSVRITVFQQDRGWKYCIANVDDRKAPHFSDEYASEQAAKEEALADLRGEPSRHQSLSVLYFEDRRRRWEELILDRSVVIDDLQLYLASSEQLGITALRKPEAKIASLLKQLDWQLTEYVKSGVSVKLVSLAEQHKAKLVELSASVSRKIEALQAKRPPKRDSQSDSRLSSELAKKVEDLILLLMNTPAIDPSEIDKRYRQAMREASLRMLNGGMTFGQASGAPDFLNQDEESFRVFVKEADQNLFWQCDTVAEAFKRYLEIGETPAPHYPIRITVLLRKEKDFDREKQFLAAWCKHFSSDKGTGYAALVERAKKVGVEF